MTSPRPAQDWPSQKHAKKTALQRILPIQTDSFCWNLPYAGAKIVDPFGPADNPDTGYRAPYHDIRILSFYGTRPVGNSLASIPTYGAHSIIQKAAMVMLMVCRDAAIEDYLGQNETAASKVSDRDAIATLIKTKTDAVNSVAVIDEAASALQWILWHLEQDDAHDGHKFIGVLLCHEIVGYSDKEGFYDKDLLVQTGAAVAVINELKTTLSLARKLAAKNDAERDNLPPPEEVEAPSWWSDTDQWAAQNKHLISLDDNPWTQTASPDIAHILQSAPSLLRSVAATKTGNSAEPAVTEPVAKLG